MMPVYRNAPLIVSRFPCVPSLSYVLRGELRGLGRGCLSKAVYEMKTFSFPMVPGVTALVLLRARDTALLGGVAFGTAASSGVVKALCVSVKALRLSVCRLPSHSPPSSLILLICLVH